MDDKLRIHLSVNDSEIPLTIPRDEEEIYREAAKCINDKLNTYRSKLAGLSKEKQANLVLLDIAVNFVKEKQRNDTGPYKEMINRLTDDLESYLNNKE